MDYGRLIRIGKYSGDPNAVAYIVAIPESAQAIELIRAKLGESGDHVEDLGRVSDALINAMKLESGDFVRA